LRKQIGHEVRDARLILLRVFSPGFGLHFFNFHWIYLWRGQIDPNALIGVQSLRDIHGSRRKFR
jgi:hypothetical protein